MAQQSSLPVFPENEETNGIQRVPLDLLDPNPYQPRQAMDQVAIEDLAGGLQINRKTLPETMGLMQVPIGREVDGRVQLAFGHRRKAAFEFNAAQRGDDWQYMPLQIVSLSDEEMYDFAARENGDRKQLNHIEKARSINLAKEEFGWTLQQAASAHGLSKGAASNLTRLLGLPEGVQQMIADGDLGQRHGRELLRLLKVSSDLEAVSRIIAIAKTCVEEDFSVREAAEQVDAAISEFNGVEEDEETEGFSITNAPEAMRLDEVHDDGGYDDEGDDGIDEDAPDWLQPVSASSEAAGSDFESSAANTSSDADTAADAPAESPDAPLPPPPPPAGKAQDNSWHLSVSIKAPDGSDVVLMDSPTLLTFSYKGETLASYNSNFISLFPDITEMIMGSIEVEQAEEETEA